MRTNRVSGRSARNGRPTSLLNGNALAAARFRGARAGSVAAVVAGILGGAAVAATPAHAQTAIAAPPTGASR